MHLLLVGISHKTAPVELRERLDFQVRGVDRALQSLAARGSTREAVVLSTCNRAEVYVACDDIAATRTDLVSFVSEFHAIDRPTVVPHVYDVAGLDAARVVPMWVIFSRRGLWRVGVESVEHAIEDLLAADLALSPKYGGTVPLVP